MSGLVDGKRQVGGYQKENVINSLFVVLFALGMTRARGDGTTKRLSLRSTRKVRRASLSKESVGKVEGGSATSDNRTSIYVQPDVSPTYTEKLTGGEVAEAQELLRQFDMTMRYGPCVGMPRSSRWKRAQHFGLDPPSCILEILRDRRYRQAILNIEENLWYTELNHKTNDM